MELVYFCQMLPDCVTSHVFVTKRGLESRHTGRGGGRGALLAKISCSVCDPARSNSLNLQQLQDSRLQDGESRGVISENHRGVPIVV